jgi:hypothetical protein
VIIVSAAPVAPPVTAGTLGQPLAVSLVGQDGSTWDLVNGPVRVTSGVAGLSGPDPEHFWRESPALDGAYHAGSRSPRGQVTLPVRVRGSTSTEWRNYHSAFMRAVDPTGECTLLVTPPDGTTRYLRMRLIAGMSPPFAIDPSLLKFAAHSLDFAAAYPFWRGTASSTLYTNLITSTSDTVVNPGDVPVWPKWTATGPFTGLTVGVTVDGVDYFTSLTGQVTAGAVRVIDTDPHSQTVAVTNGAGTDRWAALQAQAGASLRLDFIPAYRQPW